MKNKTEDHVGHNVFAFQFMSFCSIYFLNIFMYRKNYFLENLLPLYVFILDLLSLYIISIE